MANFFAKGLPALCCLLLYYSGKAQTLPVGTNMLDEFSRRQQLSGKADSNVSFAVRPLYAHNLAEFDSLYHPEEQGQFKKNNAWSFAKGKGQVILLPVNVRQQYNSSHPYGWNDGSMIQARGYQAQVSAGIFSKIGPLTIQLQPEFVYAQNKDFETFPSWHTDSIWKAYYTLLNTIDNPEKYGHGNYTKIFAGQSSIKLNYKKLALGISTENLWWGPGIRNSLIMTNNAPGFAHITFNTTAPVLSRIGSFEWQVISGRLKESGILPDDTSRMFDGAPLYVPKPNGDRYLNGMVITWQPKWTKGLFLGFSRMFYLYQNEVPSTFDGYFPVIGQFFKGATTNEDEKRRDQLLSLFFRLVLPKEKAEVYGEFGRNDHAQNSRDLMLEPEHSRAYTIGFRKLFATRKKTEFELLFELTNLENTPTEFLRERPVWYTHYQVVHGYTNKGQVIGAGIGPGANSQTIGLSWINGLKKTGILLERVLHNNDFYYEAFIPQRNPRAHWVDLSLGLNRTWYYKNLVFYGNLSYIRSLNYQWRYGTDPLTGVERKVDFNNLQAGLSVSYLF